MRAHDFREELRQRLESWGGRVVLRILVSSSDPAPVELSGKEVLERSIELADRYLNGPEKGVVLLLLPHSVELFLLHIGAILRGKIPAILAWPTSRVDPDKYQRNLLHQLRNLPAAQLVTLPGLARNLEAGLQYRISACPIARAEYWEKTFDRELVVEPAEKDVRTQAANDLQEDALFLQFSGGTTGAQKCVVVRVGMLETQLRLLSESLDFGPRDAVVSWLPMYHDMGLIACLWLPLWSGAPSVQISAQDWLMDPGLLLRFMDRFRGTYCWLPNFAFSYLAGQYGRMKGACSLGHVRGWINCSEPVRLRSMKAFTDAFSGWGVRPAQCQVSYAMAENVFAVTQTRLGGIPVMVSRSQLDRSMNLPELAYDMLDDIYVSSGRTLAGMQLRIRRADGSLGGENQQGGIEIQTECMFDGYWGNDGFQRQALTSDGWYVTGDSGFISGQELFVIGRTKDIVIVGGQNIFPEDVEMVANTVVGVYPGRVVAFGVEDVQQGTENLVVVSEMRGEFDAGKAQQIERDIHRQVLAAVGVAPRHVRVVPERWIVKSTAGKISRRETRLRFLEETATLAVGKPTK